MTDLKLIAFDAAASQFLSLGEVRPAASAPAARLANIHSGDGQFHREDKT